MKNILLAYADAQGRGPSEVISGTEAPVTETAGKLAAIKAGQVPAGINCVELWSSERGLINRWVRHVPASAPAPRLETKPKPKKN